MPLSDADKAEIKALIGESLKGDDLKGVFTEALKIHATEADKRLDARLKAEADARQKAIDEAAAKLKLSETPDDSSKGAGKGAGDPAVLKLQEQLAVLQRDLKAKDDEAKREREGRRQERLEGEFQAALAATEVRPGLRDAVQALFKAQGRIRYGVAGNDDAPGLHFKRNGYEEVVPLKEGLSEWLKSDEAKEYLAPRDVAGTGQGAGKPANGTPRTATGQIDEGALASKLLRLTA